MLQLEEMPVMISIERNWKTSTVTSLKSGFFKKKKNEDKNKRYEISLKIYLVCIAISRSEFSFRKPTPKQLVQGKVTRNNFYQRFLTRRSARTIFNATFCCGNPLRGFKDRSKTCNVLLQHNSFVKSCQAITTFKATMLCQRLSHVNITLIL